MIMPPAHKLIYSNVCFLVSITLFEGLEGVAWPTREGESLAMNFKVSKTDAWCSLVHILPTAWKSDVTSQLLL